MNKYVDDGYPVPGETIVYDTKEEIDLDAPLEGAILVKAIFLGVDPYLRGRMRAPEPNSKSYSSAFEIGKPLVNFGVAVVLRSENDKFKVGDHVYGPILYQTYATYKNTSFLRVLPNVEGLPWSVYTGIAGMAGQTAYIGWKLFSKAKKGETVFVSTAAGPVGSAVVQLAKSQGLKVVASAGSDEKVAFAKKIGADVAFNYKTQKTLDVLTGLEDGIDIFWDNVGGETLEAALEALNPHGRVINCGSISVYNSEPSKRYGVKNLFHIVTKRITMQGFIVSEHADLFEEFYAEFPKKLASGEIQYTEHRYEGLEQAGQAIVDVQKGDNKAKAVIVVSNE